MADSFKKKLRCHFAISLTISRKGVKNTLSLELQTNLCKLKEN